MVIHFTVKSLQSFKNDKVQIKACVQGSATTDLLKLHLGTFKYYHFLKDLFEDVSVFHRKSEIAFSQPGISDLCITWNIEKSITDVQLLKAIREGIHNINVTQKEKYQAKYKLNNSASLLTENDQSFDLDRVGIKMELVSSVLEKELI